MNDERIPPNNLDAEAAVISASMLSTDVLDGIAASLPSCCFYSDANRIIYEALLDIRNEGRPADIITVKSWLKDHDVWSRAGGAQYLAHIIDLVPAISNVDEYAKIIKDKWRLRQLIYECRRIAAEGFAPVDDPQAFIDHAEQRIFSIAQLEETNDAILIKGVVGDAFSQLMDAYQRGEKISGQTTGFTKLDRILGGLHAGDLIIIAARPGMGKSAAALDIGSNVAETGKAVLIFSLEMPREQVAMRMVCSDARVDLSKLRTGQLTAQDWQALTSSSSRIASLPIWIDDSSCSSVMDIRGKVRRLQALSMSNGSTLGLVVVDYLQLMSGNPGAPNREQQVSEISRSLKLLAKDLHVPVIALSQLNRACEARGKDKRPQLSDLRESGAVEQDADTVVFVYREEYYNKDNPEVAGLADFIVAKQRNGPTGTIKMRFTRSCTRFDNLEIDDDI